MTDRSKPSRRARHREIPRLSTLLLRHESRRRRRVAAERDPEMFSADAGVDGDFHALLTEAEAISDVPEAIWVKLVRWIHGRPLRQAFRRGRWASQRLRRGWDDRQLWNLDTHLCRILAEQLSAIARDAHGWPDERYETFADWQTALELNAARLAGYAGILTGDEPLQQTERRIRDAQTALHWVADNLPYLWD